MTAPQAAAAPRAAAAASNPARYFYSGAAALMLLLAFLGFNRFYLQGTAYPGREIAPPIKALVVAHGILMSAWLILLIVQPLLVVNRNIKLHMALGKLGALIAASVVVLGIFVGIRSATVTPDEVRIWNLSPKHFLIVPLVSALLFGGFVAAGIAFRMKPAVHRPMMLLATLSAMPAAVSRIDTLNALYVGTRMEQMFGAMFMTLIIGFVLVGVRWLLTKTLDRYLLIGMIILTAASYGMVQIGPTDAWGRIAASLTS